MFNVQGDTIKSLDISQHFAMIKMVVWFDEYKQEPNSNYQWVDWQFSYNATVLPSLPLQPSAPDLAGPSRL